MPTLSELMAANISNAMTNVKTWGGVIYNVKEFGAKGDGVTDDSAAVTATINAAKKSGGGTIFFPRGTYLFASESIAGAHLYLFNVHNLKFEGVGGASILKAASKDKDLILVSGGSSNITFQNLTLDRVSGAVPGGNGIHFYNWYACPNWSGINVTIQNQYNGIYASTARPQGSMWVSCRFINNVNNGVELIMNNDEFFETCVFSNNEGHGIKIGDPLSSVPSDGAVFIDNCVIYNNGLDGIHAEGNASHHNYNIFIIGGILDNQLQNGIYMKHCHTVQISTTITFSSKVGLYLGDGCREIRLDNIKVSDSAEEGIYIDSGAKFISGSGIQVLSNGRSTQSSYYGIKISGDVKYVNFVGGVSGNADDTNLDRQTQDGGIYIDGSGGIPDYLTFVGFHFPGMLNAYTKSGNVGNRIQVIDVEGRALGLFSDQYFGFSGSQGAQRVRHNSSTGNIEFEWNVGTNSGTWDGAHLVLGNYHLWVDSNGKLRIKNGAPSSDTDGALVGE